MADSKIIGSTGFDPEGGGAGRERWAYKNKMKVKMNMMRMDIKAFIDSLTSINDKTSFYRLVTEHLSIALIAYARDILDDAVAGCPYDTGKLRTSGAVDLRVGKQGRVLKDAITTMAEDDGTYEIRVHNWSVKRPSSRLEADIYFDRSDRGIDIALWTHEELLGNELRPSRQERKSMGQKRWFAVHQGTGPKYLENAMKKHRKEFVPEMDLAVKRAVRAYNRKHGQRVRRK